MGTRQRRWVVALLAGFSIAVLVIVLSPRPLQSLVTAHTDLTFASLQGHGPTARLRYPVTEFLANVALFIPVGALGALLVPRRRWLQVLVGAAALSATAEVVQALAFPHRTGSAGDVLANVIGAGLGMGLVAAVRRLRTTSLRTTGVDDPADL